VILTNEITLGLISQCSTPRVIGIWHYHVASCIALVSLGSEMNKELPIELGLTTGGK